MSVKSGSCPLISVIIPVYNGEQFLDESITSVFLQNYSPLEIIIIDDGSSDRSREIATSYTDVLYLYQENAGTAAARNRGIKMSKGDLIAFLDADDIWMPNKLALQLAALQNDLALDMVTGYVQQFLSPELAEQERRRYSFRMQPLAGFIPSAILVKKHIFGRIGLFHENCRSGEAISWFALAREKLRMGVLSNLIVKRRIHGKNLSLLDKPEKNTEIIRILKRALDRRRAEQASKSF